MHARNLLYCFFLNFFFLMKRTTPSPSSLYKDKASVSSRKKKSISCQGSVRDTGGPTNCSRWQRSTPTLFLTRSNHSRTFFWEKNAACSWSRPSLGNWKLNESYIGSDGVPVGCTNEHGSSSHNKCHTLVQPNNHMIRACVYEFPSKLFKVTRFHKKR